MDGIYQHFRPEEASVIDSLNEVIVRAKDEYRPILTHFLNPRQHFIADVLIGRFDDVKLKTFGGFSGSERKRILFYPEYYEPQDNDFSMSLLEINYPVKFAKLEHRTILGTLANCGLERDVIGDIITDGTRWQFFCEKEIEPYLLENIDRVGKVKVKLGEIPLQNAVSPIEEWEHATVVLSSLRCDVLISSAYNLSRKHVKDLLQTNKVSLNWMILSKADFEIRVHDVLSVRGYGRVRMDELTGVSKKGKFIAKVSVLKKLR